MSRGFLADWTSSRSFGLCSIFRCMWLEFSRCSACAAVGRLLRSDSKPVSRGGRPNSSRKELPTLPSARAIDRWSSGMNVNGSGMALEYFSVRAGHLAQGVDQHLRLQPAQRIVGEMRRPLALIGPRDGGELIGFRVQDQTVDVFQVVMGRDQLSLQTARAARDSAADCRDACRPARG